MMSRGMPPKKLLNNVADYLCDDATRAQLEGMVLDLMVALADSENFVLCPECNRVLEDSYVIDPVTEKVFPALACKRGCELRAYI